MTQPHPATFLRQALLANAIFSGSSALLFALFAPSMAAALGIPHPLWMYGLALGLLGFALLILLTLRLPSISPISVGLIIAADAAWVLGSMVLLWSKALPLTPAGGWGVGIVAGVVGLLAVLQTFGFLKTRGL